MTPEQCRQARALLGWSRDRLGALSGTASHVIRNYEVHGTPRGAVDKTPGEHRLAAIRAALEAAGVLFVDENGGAAGVRLRTRTEMVSLLPNEREAANRAEATALLIRAGFRVYRPEVDAHGEDLVLRDPAGRLRSVQLKSRPWVDWQRYGGRSTWMLFPEPGFVLGRPWYLLPHDELFDWFKAKHGHRPGWKAMWNTPSVSKELRAYLEPFSQQHWSPNGSTAVDPETEQLP